MRMLISVLAILPIALHVCSGLSSADVPDPVRADLRHAETFYWLGIEEKGNMSAFAAGLRYLDAAERALSAAPAGDREATDVRRQVTALRGDIVHQAEMAHDTFYGVFPAARLLGQSLFMNASSTGTYELIDEVDVVSVTAAVEKLMRSFYPYEQIDVVFNSVPADPALENEALYVVNTDPKFFVHNRKETDALLTREDREKFDANRIDPALAGTLLEGFGVSRLLIVTVVSQDFVDGVFFLTVAGQVFTGAPPAAVKHVFAMGFARDKTGLLPVITALNAALLLLALAAYAGLLKLRSGAFPPLGNVLLVGSAVFLAGRILPWAVVPFLGTIAPAPETLATLSFWWPAVVGAGLFFFPGAVLRVFSARIHAFAPAFELSGKGGAVFAVLALGICAYLVTPVCLLLDGSARGLLVPLLLSVVLTAYLAGRALDHVDPFPVANIWISIVAAAGLGLVLCHASAGVAWAGTAGLAAAFSLANIRAIRSGIEQVDDLLENIRYDGRELSIKDMIDLSENPPFHPSEDARECLAALADDYAQGLSSIIVLTGPGGRGKTATANYLVRKLCATAGSDTCAVMSGQCPDDIGEKQSYALFRQALAGYFGVNVFSPPEEQMAHVDSVLDGLFDNIVPFSGLLFPGRDSGYNPAATKHEIHLSVLRTIRKLAQQGPVVLFLDDIQWIDASSQDLLRFLVREIPAGSNLPVYVIMTSRIVEAPAILGLPVRITELSEIGSDHKAQILVESFNLEPASARFVVEQVGTAGSEKGEMFWLFHMVSELARADAFVRTASGFALAEEIIRQRALPVPVKFQQSIDLTLKQHPEYWQLFECASCLGLQFRVSILADVLDLTRMQILELLRRAEDETGIVYDDQENDDFYSFRSSLILEAIRKRGKISGNGPKSKDVPQLMREYHFKIAVAFEKALTASPQAIFDVANHYFAAGPANAEKALEYCLRAAAAATDLFSYDTARRYLENAVECGESIGREKSTSRRVLLQRCEIAHREGLGRTDVARECLDVLQTESDLSCDELIVFARACFDAAGDTHDQEMYAQAAILGSRIVDVGQSDIERAEGHHYIGLSLPVQQRERRKAELCEAYDLLERTGSADRARALLGRVANSLAEQLSYGDLADKARAGELFALSISIKESADSRDLPGLARSHGGLGRLAFFAEPPDIETARKHFEADLRYAEQTGDVVGQSKMHSFLGACSRHDGDFKTAAEHYRRAFDLAHERVDKFFAGSGLIDALCALDREGEIEPVAVELLRQAGTSTGDAPPIPPFCARPLAEALAKCSSSRSTRWFEELMPFVEEAGS